MPGAVDASLAAEDCALKVAIGIIAAVLLFGAAYQASAVLAPLAFALFIMAVVWPLQSRLQSRLSRLVALAITMLVAISVCLAFALIVAWSFGRISRLFVADARYQVFYTTVAAWLDAYGLSVSQLWSDYFNPAWLIRAVQQIAGRINTTLSFWLIALIYVILGLLEVDEMRRKLEALDRREIGEAIIKGSAVTTAKLSRYVLVRTVMSVVTGLLYGVVAWLVGLPLAVEWGVIAFVLNYIPFIGPFVATILPTVWAMTHFQSWETVLALFVCLNVIQFAVGSYVEPRVSGQALFISPFVVLFSVFFWTFLWGLFGAFIGVPITIAVVTFCEQFPSSRWLAQILGGRPPATS